MHEKRDKLKSFFLIQKVKLLFKKTGDQENQRSNIMKKGCESETWWTKTTKSGEKRMRKFRVKKNTKNREKFIFKIRKSFFLKREIQSDKTDKQVFVRKNAFLEWKRIGKKEKRKILPNRKNFVFVIFLEKCAKENSKPTNFLPWVFCQLEE